MDSKTIATVVVLILISSISIYFLSRNLLVGSSTSKSVFPQCETFSKEISSCEVAVGLALEKYSGNMYEIDKLQSPLKDGITGTSTWVVTIDLEKPIELEGKQTASKIKVIVIGSDVEIYEVVK